MCRRKGFVAAADRALLVEERAPATEASFVKVRAKFGEADGGIMAAAEAAGAISRVTLDRWRGRLEAWQGLWHRNGCGGCQF